MSQPVHRVVLPFAALIVVLPMMLRGTSCGHDFDFHLLSWLEAARQFRHFSYPHWAYTPAYNAGEPRFVFYPPLSWMLGGFLGLFLPWTSVPVAFTWITLTASGFTSYRLARSYASASSATLAATVYLANPYMLFTAYERTAYGELLAAAFIPLLFSAALATRVRLLPVAAAIALLWLANAPAAVMSCYALAFLTVARLVIARVPARPRLALTMAGGTVLGLALASFYIVPAAYERRFVQVDMAVTEGMRVSDHFLFHHMPGQSADHAFHDAVVQTASYVAVTLLALIAATWIVARRKRAAEAAPLTPLGSLAIVIAFLLTPPSAMVWRIVPQLHFLQFPWRLCAILAAILCVFVAVSIGRTLPTMQAVAAALGLCAILVAPAWILFHQSCDEEDAVPGRVALFQSNLGTEPTDEYTPGNADPDALHPHDPPYWLLPSSASIDSPAPADAAPGPAPTHLTLTLATPGLLVLNLRQYPAWRFLLNQHPAAPVSPSRDDGLVALALPAGADTIDIRFARTPDENVGLGISGLAALLACGLGYRARTRAS